MRVAVIPAKDEQGRIGRVLTMLGGTLLDRIIVVVNGSRDGTLSEIQKLNMAQVEVILFDSVLGIDVPRAVGAYAAFKRGATSVVFVDGDMIGKIDEIVRRLIHAVIYQKADLAMTDCYPKMPFGNKLADRMLSYRKLLNEEMDIYDQIGVATPSHGPHVVSRRLMEDVDFKDFAVPPMILAYAVKHSFDIAVPVSTAQVHLGSKVKGYYHSKNIADTVIGHTIEALCFYRDQPRTRRYLCKDYQGYNPSRRFDILDVYMGRK